MTTLALSDGIIKDEILVVALAYKKSMRDGKANLVIESGDIALDSKKLLPILADLGATGKFDEVLESQLGYSYSRALANIALQ